jgi:hypothetical protein
MTKIFIDTEFMDNGKTIELISLAMVMPDDQWFYWVNKDADLSKANDWVKAHVVPKLYKNKPLVESPSQIADGMLQMVKLYCPGGAKPEFWGYYADYDWVAVAQLFGPMIALPKGWPMFCRDIRQFAHHLGNPELPKQGKGEHNALDDARWNKAAYECLFHYAQFNPTAWRV